jgi:hypothetical protein
MKEQTRAAIDLLLRGATRFGGVLRQHFKAKTAPDCETGTVVEKEVSTRGLASLEKRVERIASVLARIEKNSERGGRALTNALDDYEREYNALSRGARRYCRRSDAWIASQRKFTAFALGYLRGVASAPQGAKRATEAPPKVEASKTKEEPQKAPQKPAAKVSEGSRELPTAEDCRDRGIGAFKGKYAVVQAIACCVHAAARDHSVKPSEFRVTRARGSHLSLTVRMVRTGRAMRFTGTTTPKGYRSACASVSAFFSSLAKAAKKDEKPTVKPNYPKTRTAQTALASHGLRAESTMPADLLALEFAAYTMNAADQDRVADEHKVLVERAVKAGREIDPRVAGHYNLAVVEHAPVVPEEPKLTTEQLSELTEDQQRELKRLETMPLDEAETEYQRIAKAARFLGGGVDAVFKGKRRMVIAENKREITDMKGRNEDLDADKRLMSLKGTAHEGKANAVDYWIVFGKGVTKAEAEKTLGDYLDVLDAAGHQGRNDIVSLWTKTMRALGYSDALIRTNHMKDAARRILSKRRAEASKEATSDVKWVRVDLEQNVVRLKFGRKPAAGSETALKTAGYGLVSKGHENPFWRATWSQKARDAALAVGANAADLPEIAAPKPVEKPAVKPVEAPAPVEAKPEAPKVEAAPVVEAPKPDVNLEAMARMVAELLVRPEGATTGEIAAAGGGTPAAVYKTLTNLGVPIITGTQVNPGASGRDVGTENVWQVRGVDDNGVSQRGAKNIRVVLSALKLPPVDMAVTNEETPKPAPRPATIPPPARAETPEPHKPASNSHYNDPQASVHTRNRWAKSVGHLAWVWNKNMSEWYEIGTRDGKGVEAYAALASSAVDAATGVRPYNMFNRTESARDWLRGVWGYRGTMQGPKVAPEAPAVQPPTVEVAVAPARVESNDEAVRRAAEEIARELGFTLEPTAPPAPEPPPAAPSTSVETPEEKREREMIEQFERGLAARRAGKTVSSPDAPPEPPLAPAPREMSAQERANAEMEAFMREWDA